MTDALVAALIEVERHVGRSGWDQPSRLFALVRTSELIAAEPSLADQLTGAPDGYSSIEQEDFTPGDDLAETLAGIAWPEAVSGCVLTLERAFLPSDAEGELPVVLTAPVTEFRVVAIMGGVSLRVPDGVAVRMEAFGFMGGTAQPKGDAPPDAPVIRFQGVAIMGGIDVKRSKRPRAVGGEAAPQLGS